MFDYGEWLSNVLGISQAGVLAQIVISGKGLGPEAQLALVAGMVLCNVVALLLAHLRKRGRDDD